LQRFLQTRRWLAICGIWTALGTLGFTRHYLQELGSAAAVPFWAGLLPWLACYFAWIPLTPLLLSLERRYPLEAPNRGAHLALLGAASLAFSYSAYALTQMLVAVLSALERNPALSANQSWAMPVTELCIEEALFWLLVVAAVGLRRFAELEERRSEAARFEIEKANIEAELRKAELESLRMRLNPHFLFNALQGISVLAQQDARTAARMLTRLGDLLRTAIRPDFQTDVPLSREMDLTRAYLEIEKMRFGERLEYQITMEAGTEAASVPSLLLQPLVENAIVHGLAGITRKGRIDISSHWQASCLLLSVSDNGVGFAHNRDTTGTGVGLGSTYERLKRLYPEDEELILLEPRPEGGTAVRIRIRQRAHTDMAAV
jgi:two-component system LytT family sensor kinase